MDDSSPQATVELFLGKFRHEWPAEQHRDLTIVAAVSGGADSVSLLRAIHTVHPHAEDSLVVAHVNHRLRGQESDADEAFVKELSESLRLRCEVVRLDADSLKQPHGQTSESAARHARYRNLRAVAETCGARLIATAHTADDQAETVLHRLLRGTGLHGAAGIPRVRALTPFLSVIRPLLGFRRADVRRFLSALGQNFREDSSNSDPRFTRNRMRHHLIPWIERDYNRRVKEALLRFSALAAETQDLLSQLSEQLADRCVTPLGHDQLEIDCRRLVGVPPLLFRTLLLQLWNVRQWPLRDMGLEQWNQLATMAAPDRADVIHATFPGAVRVIRKGPILSIRRVTGD